MKIKKKEYKKELSDAYWNGLKVGMEFALDNPEMAKKYRDRTETIRAMSEKFSDAMSKLAEGISKALQQMRGAE